MKAGIAGFDIMTIKNVPVDSNCYLITYLPTDRAVIIDPGCENSSSIITCLIDNKIKVDYIFLTHEHFDHIWGVNSIKESFQCRIVCSKECSNSITDKRKNLSLYYNQVGFDTYPADIYFDKPDFNLNWCGHDFIFYKTKGHSSGSISIKFGNALFTGDTVIKDTKTVIKLPDSSKEELVTSLNLLKSLSNENTVIYPGHGDSFSAVLFEIENCL